MSNSITPATRNDNAARTQMSQGGVGAAQVTGVARGGQKPENIKTHRTFLITGGQPPAGPTVASGDGEDSRQRRPAGGNEENCKALQIKL